MIKVRLKSILGAGLLVLGALAVPAASAAPSVIAPTPPALAVPAASAAPSVIAPTPPEPTGAVTYSPANGSSGGFSTLAEGPCVLYPSVVHQRASGNYETVGNKPYTNCNVPVTSIHHSTTVYKTAWWGNVDSGTFTGGNFGQSVYTQRNVAVTCTNSLSTTWFAVTNGTIVYGGTTYYAEARTPYDAYDCGT
jgi:hypothetical protein